MKIGRGFLGAVGGGSGVGPLLGGPAGWCGGGAQIMRGKSSSGFFLEGASVEIFRFTEASDVGPTLGGPAGRGGGGAQLVGSTLPIC
eukprot:scaffold12831_cov129-Isochrysis_galbana.AAC.1